MVKEKRTMYDLERFLKEKKIVAKIKFCGHVYWLKMIITVSLTMDFEMHQLHWLKVTKLGEVASNYLKWDAIC